MRDRHGSTDPGRLCGRKPDSRAQGHLMKTLIIAEAGVNHNGDMDMARRLVDAAAFAGADLVKFQTFVATRLVTHYAGKAAYQEQDRVGESQLQMLQPLELS